MSERLTERLQVLIDRDQRARLDEMARARGVSVATLVRSAIDVAYPGPAAARAAAAAAILDAPASEAPPLAELLAELDEVRGRRG